MSSASADRIKDDAWWIPRVFVHPKHRGQGVGSSLLQELVKRCLEQGPDRIEVAPGGYESDPERQRNFYTKNGFVELLEDPGMFIYQNHEVP